MAFWRFRLPSKVPVRMASSLESGRNTFLQAAKLNLNFSKADTDSQREAISRSLICLSTFSSLNHIYTFNTLIIPAFFSGHGDSPNR